MNSAMMEDVVVYMRFNVDAWRLILWLSLSGAFVVEEERFVFVGGCCVIRFRVDFPCPLKVGRGRKVGRYFSCVFLVFSSSLTACCFVNGTSSNC